MAAVLFSFAVIGVACGDDDRNDSGDLECPNVDAGNGDVMRISAMTSLLKTLRMRISLTRLSVMPTSDVANDASDLFPNQPGGNPLVPEVAAFPFPSDFIW